MQRRYASLERKLEQQQSEIAELKAIVAGKAIVSFVVCWAFRFCSKSSVADEPGANSVCKCFFGASKGRAATAADRTGEVSKNENRLFSCLFVKFECVSVLANAHSSGVTALCPAQIGDRFVLFTGGHDAHIKVGAKTKVFLICDKILRFGMWMCDLERAGSGEKWKRISKKKKGGGNRWVVLMLFARKKDFRFGVWFVFVRRCCAQQALTVRSCAGTRKRCRLNGRKKKIGNHFQFPFTALGARANDASWGQDLLYDWIWRHVVHWQCRQIDPSEEQQSEMVFCFHFRFLQVWDVRVGARNPAQVLQGHSRSVWSLKMAPLSLGGEDALLSAGNCGNVNLWDLRMGKVESQTRTKKKNLCLC